VTAEPPERSGSSAVPARRSDRHRGATPGPQRRSLIARVDGAAVRTREWFESVRGAIPWAGLAVAAGLIVLVLARGWLHTAVASVEPLSAWLAVVASVCLQGLPFLVAGVLLSAALSVWLLPRMARRLSWPVAPDADDSGVVPASRRGGPLAVPVSALAGLVLPQTSARAADTAAEWCRAGVTPGAAHAYRLSAASANPVALVSTAVFFPGQPGVLAARVGIGLVLALLVGWAWPVLSGASAARAGGLRAVPAGAEDSAEVGRFIDRARDDLLRGGGHLALAAALAAAFSQLVPASWLEAAGGSTLAAVAVAGVLAVLGGADAMANAVVAVSLTRFPLVAQLAYLVVGPAADLSTAVRLTAWLGRRGAAQVTVVAGALAVLGAVAAGVVLT